MVYTSGKMLPPVIARDPRRFVDAAHIPLSGLVRCFKLQILYLSTLLKIILLLGEYGIYKTNMRNL